MTFPPSAERERQAFRIAGQAVGALLIGAPIERVSVEDGMRILWSELRHPARRPDDRILARILIILMGVGARQRYSFGVPPSDVVLLMPRADEPQLQRDVEQADGASVGLSDAAGDGLAAVWRYAGELVFDDDVWEVIEIAAEELLEGPLDGRQIAYLCRSRGDA